MEIEMNQELDKGQMSRDILSSITIFSKYAKYLPENKRRENWKDIIERNKSMHKKKYPALCDEIDVMYEYVLDKYVLPSMRSLQFAGKPIELCPSRLFNCAFTACDDTAVFSEAMFLLLGGTGLGFSVQRHHIDQLPELVGPKRNNRKRRYLVGDSIEGWANAVKTLVDSYYEHTNEINFDFGDIRDKGALLVTSGGKAPGPQPLKDCIHNIRKIFDAALDDRGEGTQLIPIEVHDVMCYIAAAVLSGGIRRAALISLFSLDDDEMMACKTNDWRTKHPQRACANNSVVLVRHKIRKRHFEVLWERIKASGFGEPGIFFTNDKDMGANPCFEISLKSNSFCNLTTVNVGQIKTQEELEMRVKAASFIGTLQASYTDFHYLREVWQKNSERDCLLGVSMTGIGSGAILKLDLEKAAKVAVEENKRVAKLISINPALRITCIKPEGTASCVVGTSSGIHAWHAPHYIRRLRLLKDEELHSYLTRRIRSLIEDEYFNPTKYSVLSLPINAPRGSIYRTETELELLARVKLFHDRWVKPGHIKGSNTHNVSVTVSIRDSKWDEVGEWMWNNRSSYNGISVLPFDGGNYQQMPFEECNKATYDDMLEKIKSIDLDKISEEIDMTDLKGEVACAGGSCSLTHI
jgi:ribonucleoside-diphosphate reductase alpha chain